MASVHYSSADARGGAGLWRELAHARGLLLQLVLKDIRVRYRYTAVGALWAVLEPLALMAVLAFVFSFVLADRADFARGSERAPYAVFLLTGLLFWQFTAASLTNAAACLLDNRNLIKKVRFPREVLPLAALGYPLINLGIGLVILLVLHVSLGGALSPMLALLPLVFAVQVLLTAGLALLLSCGNVHYRDVGYILAVALLLGFYATPILYPSSLVDAAALPAWAINLYHLNPMAGLIEVYRSVLLDGTLNPIQLAWPAACAVLLFLAGTLLFRRLSPTLSDHL